MEYNPTDPTLIGTDRSTRLLQVLDALTALDVAIDRIPDGRRLLAEWQAGPDRLLDMLDAGVLDWPRQTDDAAPTLT